MYDKSAGMYSFHTFHIGTLYGRIKVRPRVQRTVVERAGLGNIVKSDRLTNSANRCVAVQPVEWSGLCGCSIGRVPVYLQTGFANCNPPVGWMVRGQTD